MAIERTAALSAAIETRQSTRPLPGPMSGNFDHVRAAPSRADTERADSHPLFAPPLSSRPLSTIHTRHGLTAPDHTSSLHRVTGPG